MTTPAPTEPTNSTQPGDEQPEAGTYRVGSLTLRRLDPRDILGIAVVVCLIMFLMSRVVTVHPSSVGVAFVLACLSQAGLGMGRLRNWAIFLPVALAVSVLMQLAAKLLGYGA